MGKTENLIESRDWEKNTNNDSIFKYIEEMKVLEDLSFLLLFT